MYVQKKSFMITNDQFKFLHLKTIGSDMNIVSHYTTQGIKISQ